MKSACVWSVLFLCSLVANLAAQEVAAPPRKFKSAEECFAALQKATQSDPVDYATVVACQSPAMNNVQAGQIAFHLTRGAWSQVLPKKDVDPFLIKHDLGDVDIYEVLQIASSRNDIGELRGFNMIGSRITDKQAFLKGSAAWMKTYAEKFQEEEAKKPADEKPVLKLAKIETTGDTTQAEIVDKDGKPLGPVTFRLIDGSWVLGFPGKEPRVKVYTKAQREALAKLEQKGHIREGKEENDFALEYSPSMLDEIADDDLRLFQGVSFQAIRLDGTKVTDAGLKHLESQPALAALSLSDTKVTEAGVLSLVRHKQLKALMLGNLDISPTALDQLKAALPKCEIHHGWRLFWAVSGEEALDRALARGPVLLALGDEKTEKRLHTWRQKLHTREAVLLQRETKLEGIILYTDDNFSKPPAGVDAKKIPQVLLYTKAGAKPIVLSEEATGAELLAEIKKALGK